MNQTAGSQGGSLFRAKSPQHQIPPTPRREQTPGTSHTTDDQAVDINAPALTTLNQRQRRAQEALDELEGPLVSTASRKYTPEHAKTLQQNIKRLLEASKDPEPSVQTESDSDYELPETPSRTSSTRITPGQATTLGQGPGQGQTRRRHPEEEPGVSDHIDSAPHIAVGQRKVKRLKTGTQVGLEVPSVCLSKLRPQPLRFQFPPHPDEDRSNVWYQNEFRKLFNRLDDFAREYFGLHDLDEKKFHEPWAAGMTPEFVRYVEMVAEEDPELYGWDNLLRDTKQRQWLIVAVLVRILEVKIFGTDLWGADKEEKKLLFDLERAFVQREGVLK
jgi:hypothetical protein